MLNKFLYIVITTLVWFQGMVTSFNQLKKNKKVLFGSITICFTHCLAYFSLSLEKNVHFSEKYALLEIKLSLARELTEK